jgi:hypothetical protein
VGAAVAAGTARAAVRSVREISFRMVFRNLRVWGSWAFPVDVDVGRCLRPAKGKSLERGTSALR